MTARRTRLAATTPKTAALQDEANQFGAGVGLVHTLFLHGNSVASHTMA